MPSPFGAVALPAPETLAPPPRLLRRRLGRATTAESGVVLAAFIVTVGLATGAFGMHVAERNAVATWVKQA